MRTISANPVRDLPVLKDARVPIEIEDNHRSTGRIAVQVILPRLDAVSRWSIKILLVLPKPSGDFCTCCPASNDVLGHPASKTVAALPIASPLSIVRSRVRIALSSTTLRSRAGSFLVRARRHAGIPKAATARLAASRPRMVSRFNLRGHIGSRSSPDPEARRSAAPASGGRRIRGSRRDVCNQTSPRRPRKRGCMFRARLPPPGRSRRRGLERCSIAPRAGERVPRASDRH